MKSCSSMSTKSSLMYVVCTGCVGYTVSSRVFVSCTHAHTHSRMHAFTHARMHARAHAFTHARTHARTHPHTHAHTHTPMHTHPRTHAPTYACTRSPTHPHVHACIHAYTFSPHPPIAQCKSAGLFLAGLLYVRWRRLITTRLHRLYFQGINYYYLNITDGTIDNP